LSDSHYIKITLSSGKINLAGIVVTK